MKKLIYTLAAIGLTAGTAYAQAGADPAPAPDTEAAPDPSDEAQPADEPDAGAPADAAAPAAAAAAPAPAAAASYTDAEIDSFAHAAVKVRQINADTSLDATQKQTRMAAAVTEAGLDPAKYNEIAQAVSADAALRARVQGAVARQAPPTDG